MFKNTLRLICFMAVALGHHANNFAAQTPIQQNNVAQNTAMEEDAFIREFVKSKGNPKIEYDGESLVVYACSSEFEYTISIIGLVLSISIGIASFGCDNTELRYKGITLSLIPDLLFLIILCTNLYYDLNKVPFVVIDDYKIQDSRHHSVEWDYVDKIKIENIANYHTIKLCDKFLNSLLVLSNRATCLPISANNLFAILEHYLEKNKSKKLKLMGSRKKYSF